METRQVTRGTSRKSRHVHNNAPTSSPNAARLTLKYPSNPRVFLTNSPTVTTMSQHSQSLMHTPNHTNTSSPALLPSSDLSQPESTSNPQSKLSHARKQPDGHIRRPRNAFILFRSQFFNSFHCFYPLTLLPSGHFVQEAKLTVRVFFLMKRDSC